jgi:hypothetical protein
MSDARSNRVFQAPNSHIRFRGTRPPERSEAKSRDPVRMTQSAATGLLDFARNDNDDDAVLRHA